MRKLASIQRISAIEPIANADAIVKATILGWQVVVKKDEFKQGDLCVYFEIDSLMPAMPEFEFLRERKFRIKTVKLRGQVSQGICFPTTILPESFAIEEGADVTQFLGIKQWEPFQEEQRLRPQTGKIRYPRWMPRWFQNLIHKIRFVREYYRKHSGQKTFPSLIPKTDETRVQVLQPLLDKYAGTKCYITEKLDGSSITVYQINGKFGVCSRNLDLFRDKYDLYWSTVMEHDLEKKFKKHFGKDNIAIQGELIGPSVQGNKYKLRKCDIYFFNVYFIKKHAYGNLTELKEVCQLLDEKTVPVLNEDYILSQSIPDLVELSKGTSTLSETLREGIVIRPYNEISDRELDCQLVKNRISFKSINPDFLLKYDE